MARLIKSSGEVIPNVDISSLKKMQDLVQGYIEFVYLNEKLLVVNEEGLIMNLPPNKQIYLVYYMYTYYLYLACQDQSSSALHPEVILENKPRHQFY